MNAPVTRRALLGASTAAIGVVALPAATTVTAAAGHLALSHNDGRLVALADTYEALERACAAHTTKVRDLSLVEQDEEGFHEIARHLVPIEDELTEIPSDTLVGVVAKARLCQARGLRDCGDTAVLLSVADDVWRLFGQGGTT